MRRPLHRRCARHDDVNQNTAQSLGITDRTDAEQSISGGVRYLQDMMSKVPESVPENERIWFALAAYNMGYAHMLDARALTAKPKGIPDSWADVKQRLPLLSQKPYYSKLTYGYARGHEAYAYVENIRKYQISCGLSARERAGYRSGDATGAGLSGGIAYGVGQREISFSLVSFPVVIKLFDPLSSLLFSRKGVKKTKLICRVALFFCALISGGACERSH